MFNRRLITILLLGFSSGLPLALTGATLQAWYTVYGVDLVTIGMLGLLGQPYVYKFLWAPFLDRFTFRFLGRRRAWMLLTQVGLMLSIAIMSLFDPIHHPWLLAGMALLVAIFSATQDMAVDAYRTDLTPPDERGLSAAMFVSGYRVAMLVSGGLALILSAYFGWRASYFLLGSMMSVGLFATWLGPEPVDDEYVQVPKSMKIALTEPFKEFMSRDFAVALLLLVVLYKLGDAFALSLTTTFLIRGLGFSLIDVGTTYKIVGLIATLSGAFIGGNIMKRYGLYRSLLWFGILQAISNLTYFLLAIAGKNYVMMVSAVTIENLCGGMGTAAFLAFLMSLCDRRYTATQFALFSALSAIGRVFVGPLAGIIVTEIGWEAFYLWTVVIALPSIGLIYALREHIGQTIAPEPTVL